MFQQLVDRCKELSQQDVQPLHPKEENGDIKNQPIMNI